MDLNNRETNSYNGQNVPKTQVVMDLNNINNSAKKMDKYSIDESYSE